jgi:hypothetical protein
MSEPNKTERNVASPNVRSMHLVMTLLVIAVGVLNVLWGERVTAGGGLGWDGVKYANLVRHLPDMISDGELSKYYAQRILPPAIVRLTLDAVRAPYTNGNIVTAFLLLNLALLVVGSGFWKRICDACRLKPIGRWVGFAALFFSFQASKQTFFLPVLTDTAALVVSLSLVLCYLEARTFGLFFTTVLGSFVWPTIGISGAVLLLFPRGKAENESRTEKGSATISRALWLWYGGFVCACVMGYVLLLFFESPLGPECSRSMRAMLRWIPAHLQSFVDALVPTDDPCLGYKKAITGLPSTVGLLLLLLVVLDRPQRWSIQKVSFGKARQAAIPIMLAVVALLAPAVVVRLISNPLVPTAGSPAKVLWWITFPADGKFFLPVVTLVSYWGPLVLVALLRWRDFSVRIRSLGLGFVIVVCVVLPFSLTNEPRFLMNVWPFVVVGVALVINQDAPGSEFKWAFVVLTMLLSQFWLPINAVDWTGGDEEKLLEFPKQLWFMHLGFWMGWPAYIAQSVAFFLASAWLRWTMRLRASPAGTGEVCRTIVVPGVS